MSHKKVVKEFYDVVFNGHDMEAVPKYMREDYIQHNPGVPQGMQGFIEAFRVKFQQDPTFNVEIQMLIEEENMVCVYLKKRDPEGNTQVRVVDIYRLQDGKLAEHWDVLHRV